MDKKKQFQINTIKSKLDTYNTNLQILLNKYNELSEKQQQINPNLDNINKLKDNKNFLETDIKKIRNNISNFSNNYSENKQKLLKLPEDKTNKLNQEIQIKNEELDRITNQKTYYNDKLKQDLENAELDRLQLQTEIELIKTEIDKQNNIISNIQLTAHSSRKGLLSDLQQKKKNKNEIKEQQTNLENQINDINKQNDEFNIKINELNEFKKMIIDMKYNSPINVEKLNSYYIEFNISENILISDKLKQIDDIINNLIRKNDIINRRFQKNKQSQEISINQIIDNYNKVHRIQVIAYKDQYKCEKEKRNKLNEILNYLTNQYNNFDINIIGNINDTFSRTINELNEDIKKSEQRLEIMTIRINDEYEKNKTYLEQQNTDINENIKQNTQNINVITDKINIIIQQMENENSFALESDKLKEEINKYENIIKQLENDLSILMK